MSNALDKKINIKDFNLNVGFAKEKIIFESDNVASIESSFLPFPYKVVKNPIGEDWLIQENEYFKGGVELNSKELLNILNAEKKNKIVLEDGSEITFWNYSSDFTIRNSLGQFETIYISISDKKEYYEDNDIPISELKEFDSFNFYYLEDLDPSLFDEELEFEEEYNFIKIEDPIIIQKLNKVMSIIKEVL